MENVKFGRLRKVSSTVAYFILLISSMMLLAVICGAVFGAYFGSLIYGAIQCYISINPSATSVWTGTMLSMANRFGNAVANLATNISSFFNPNSAPVAA